MRREQAPALQRADGRAKKASPSSWDAKGRRTFGGNGNVSWTVETPVPTKGRRTCGGRGDDMRREQAPALQCADGRCVKSLPFVMGSNHADGRSVGKPSLCKGRGTARAVEGLFQREVTSSPNNPTVIFLRKCHLPLHRGGKRQT